MVQRRLPPLHAVRAFEAVARHLSMTRAAEELLVTPGAVSRHIRSLETHMGQALLLRRSTGLVLTVAGAALAEATRDGLDRIAGAAADLKLRRTRPLSVGAYGYFLSRLLLPRWQQLLDSCPDLEIDLHSSLNPLDLIPTHYDAVIAVSDANPRTGLVVRPLVPIRTVAVCSPAFVADGPVDFSAARLLHTRPRPDDWRRWLDHARITGVASPERGSSFESISLTMEAAAAGLGIAIAIEPLITEELESGRLVRAHRNVRPTRNHFALIYDVRSASDPSLLRFERWLTEITAPLRAAPEADPGHAAP